MIVAILVICFVLVLRHLDRKNRERDRQKLGVPVIAAADFATMKAALAELSERLNRLEAEYHRLEATEFELAQPAGGVR